MIMSQSLSCMLSPLTSQSSTSSSHLSQSSPQGSQSQTCSPQASLQSLAQPAANQNAIKNAVVILDKTRLQKLVQEVDPNEQLEEDVEDMLLAISDDFIESLVSTSAMIAKHRKATSLDVRDVHLALEKNWNMWIPGFGCDDTRTPKKSLSTEAHKQRMALIRKTLKKF